MKTIICIALLLIGELGDITTTLIDTARGDIELNPIITSTHMTVPVFIFAKLLPVVIIASLALFYRPAPKVQGFIQNCCLFVSGALFCVTLSNAALMLQ